MDFEINPKQRVIRRTVRGFATSRIGPIAHELDQQARFPWELMDDAPVSIAPLVEQFAADLADGIPDAPWPPVYPKMPNEAPRVQPSRARQPDA